MFAWIDTSLLSNTADRWWNFLLLLTVNGSVLLITVGLVNLVLRRASSAVRHLVWTAGVACVVMLPLLTKGLSPWRQEFWPVRLSSPSTVPAMRTMSPAYPLPIRISQDYQSSQVSQISQIARFSQVPAPDASSAEGGRTGTTTPEQAAWPTTHSIFNPDRDGVDRSILQPRLWATLFSLKPTVWLFFLWQAGVLLLLGILGGGLLRLAWLQAHATALQDREWTELVASLATKLDIRRPIQLLRSDRQLTPMTWGVRRPVVLLPQACDAWSPAQRSEVLVHELAHVKRHDCLTQGIAQLACVVYWFNPLVWLAARRMRIERERACDDQVLLTGAKPSAYAGHLLQIACSLGSARVTGGLSVAMARRSQISGRLMALLDPKRRRHHPGRIVAAAVGLLTLIATVPLALFGTSSPDVAAAPLTGELSLAGGLAANTSSTAAPMNNHSEDIPMSRAGATATARTSAAVAVRTDAAIDERTENATTDRTEATATARAESPAEARSTTLATSASASTVVKSQSGSANWVYSDDGYSLEVKMEGEIEFNIETRLPIRLGDGASFELKETRDGERRRLVVEPDEDGEPQYAYYEGRRKQPFDDEAQEWFAQAMRKAFKQLGIGIDTRVRQIYKSGGMEAVLAEIEEIDSDFSRSRYYSEALALDEITSGDRQSLLKHAGQHLDSDFAKAQVLNRSLDDFMSDPGLRQTYFETAQSIDSDFQKRQTLHAALKSGQLRNEDVVLLLNAAEGLDSDFELGQLLAGIDPEQLADPQLREAFFKAVGGLESDFERGRVLKATLDSDSVPRAMTLAVLEALGDMDSDFEKGNILAIVADHWHEDDEEREAYFRAVDSLDSDFERKRALQALTQRDDTMLVTVIELLRSVGRMDSDFEKTNLLMDLIPHCAHDEKLQNAFELAADTIDSEFNYGKVMKAYREAKKRI